jgi:hypothetical protein
MLRSSLHLTLVAAVSVASLTLPAPALALAPAAVDPDALYEEGRKDFNGGFYKSAIEKFEAAYKRSKDPLILYNIGQTYRKLHEDDPQLESLKKARSAFQNYVAAIEKDPGLGADPEEVKPIIADIEAELARREPAAQPEGPTEPDQPTPTTRSDTDPGKKLRLAGIGMMGGGGAMLLIGGIVGGVFAGKGGRLSDALNGDGGLYDQQRAMGCPKEMVANEGTACTQVRSDIDSTRSAGERSNLASGVAFGVLGGLGALLLIGGAASFSVGRKRSAAWQATAARVRVAPSFGGLVVQGRF